MEFREDVQKEYSILKEQREVLVSWDKFRLKLERNVKEEIENISNEEEALINDSARFIAENKPRLKRASYKTYFPKNIFIIFSIIAFYVGYFLFKDKNVYIYHLISLLVPIIFMIVSMIVYRFSLIKGKDKGRIYKPIVDYFLLIFVSIPILFLPWKFGKISNITVMPIITIIPIIIDIIYVIVCVSLWNKKMDKCRLHENMVNEQLKIFEDKKIDVTEQGELEYKNKEREYFALEEIDIYLPSFTNGNDIDEMLKYFEDRRVETIKEAVNLFYIEKQNKTVNSKLEQLLQKVDDIVLTEQEVHDEMKNMRLSTINQLGGVQEAIVDTIKRDRTVKMTATQKKKYEKRLAKNAKQDEKKENKQLQKEQKKSDKEAELEQRRLEQEEREAEKEARIIAKREEKIKKELEKKTNEEETNNNEE